MTLSATIFGCSGLSLDASEKAFFRDARPWGFILFKRNVDTPDQVRALCAELRESVGRDAPILIDQEGGRVRRLREPHWPSYPPGRAYANPALPMEMRERAARLGARLIARDLAALGVDVDCLPVLDVPVAGAHDVIGDRAYGEDPTLVARLGRAAAQGLLDEGVLPVAKHIPGHGRAGVDSHHALPVVDADREALEERDFAPFRALADLPLAMTAHVVYTAIDPDNCATHSRRVVDEVIRGHIGFDGLLMSDDVGMHALAGDFAQRTRALFEAGCDIALHCSGAMAEMTAVASQARDLSGAAAARSDRALALRKGRGSDFDPVDARAELDGLLAASA